MPARNVPAPAIRQPWLEPSLLALFLVFSGCGQIHKYTGLPGVAVYAAGTFAACILICRNLPALARHERLWPRLMIAVALFTAIAFIVLYPLAQSGALGGQGSDRDEALNQGLAALAAGRYPYYEITYLGNPLTPMPGGLLLAAPAWLLGNAAWQNLLWPALLFLFLWRSFTPVMAVLLAAGAVAFYPGAIQDLASGGDYIDNAIYVLLATASVMATARGPRLPHIAALVFLGIAVCCRAIYVVAPVALAAMFWRHLGAGAAFRVLAVSGAVALALALPFYLYDPAGFSPLQVAALKVDIPIPHAAALLGLLSLAVAALAIRLPFDAFALYGWIGLALFAAFGPVILHWSIKEPSWSFLLMGQAAPSTLFASLWIAKRLERKYGLTRKET